MADIKKTIKALKDWKNDPLAMNAEIDPCLVDDALSVIEQMEQRIKQFMQEQEPLEPVVFGNGKTFEEAETWWYGCPVCKKPVDTTDNFCRKCGRAITWQKDGDGEDER